MIRRVSNCVDCGLGDCRSCTSLEYICDNCGSEDTLYYYGNLEACSNCIGELLMLDNEKIESEEENLTCENCGEDHKELYIFDSKRLCKLCMYESFDFIECTGESEE